MTFWAKGTQFLRGDGDLQDEQFIPMGKATDISGPSVERETIDVSSHDSPNDYREHISGWIDGGEISFEVHFDPEQHLIIMDDFEDRSVMNYRLQLPDEVGGYFEFQAFITGAEFSFPTEDSAKASLTFKITGPTEFVEDGS